MTDSVGNKPPPLRLDEENLAAEWEVWHDDLEWYMDALRIKADEDSCRIGLLLNVAGPEARRLYKTFEYPEGKSNKSYKDVKEMFAAHCQPKKNLVYERYGFITKRQEEGESFSCLVTDLKQRAASCDFGELRDSMIVMMIIVALRCGKLKDKMLKETELTLVKAITMGRTNELTQRQMKVMHPAETGAIATVAAKKPRAAQPSASGATGGGHQNGRQQYRQRQAGRGNNNQSGNDYDCTKCGTRHKPRMCPAFKATCIICKKSGTLCVMPRSTLLKHTWMMMISLIMRTWRSVISLFIQLMYDR